GSGGRADEPGIIDRYIDEWKPQGEALKGFEFAMDCGNGMAGAVAPRLFRELGAVVHGLFLDPDGTFPNHEADPTQEATLQALKAEVAGRRVRIGIAYDG